MPGPLECRCSPEIPRMSASNHNYVCFNCRTAIRHPKTASRAPRCLTCGVECFCLGYMVEVPRHDDLRAWRDLHTECERRLQASQKTSVLGTVRRQHFLEQKIRRLGSMVSNQDRNRQIKRLEEELELISRNKSEDQSIVPNRSLAFTSNSAFTVCSQEDS